MAKLFGTDGVRGVANRDLTVELAYKLGRAGAYILSKKTGNKKPLIVIGQDTRISGHMLEGALIAGICSVGGDVVKAGVIPTPGVSYLTKLLNATAGIVISASHNPFGDNGIKFFSATGHKLPDSVEAEIEQLVLSEDKMPFPVDEDLGLVKELEDACEKYTSFAKSTIATKLNNIKVVVDCANGAAFQAAPQALKELGAEVIVINDQPNGININKNCGSTHLEELKKEVLKYGADIGIAHDGDADRMLAVDEKGNVVDGDQIMVACGLYLKEKGLLKNNTLVVTVMSNIGLHLALKQAGITVYQTQVGDRYVLEKMVEVGGSLGGEQSGHIIFLDHNTTGDGLVTALQLLQVMVDTGKPLSQLAAQMEIFPQILLNARVENKGKLMSNPIFLEKIEEIEGKLKGEGRVLVRPSGTEPLMRVMVEGPKIDLIKSMAEELAALATELDK